MENNLQALIERARGLNERVSDEINNSGSNFCRFCSENGSLCGVAEAPFEERQRLISIGESLKNVEKMLLVLQKLESWQQVDQNSTLAQLEESRQSLIQKVTQHQGRALQVLQELNTLFGNEESGCRWNLKEKKEEKGSADENGQKKRSSNFFISCIQVLVNPWKWQNAAGVAVRLMAVSASISSTIHLYRSRQQSRTSQTKFQLQALMNSKEAAKNDFLLTIPNTTPLDVLYGRG